ncbi:zeta toxin family protein [Microbacterium flavum]|uniref:UDP-N-acetylglucosamine kinase n=1 Tax=Microbacterium flavum TaxID=415216 RepID=A0ABS5XV51_9MICO|nr:zeta toxin family protein [Microbacterium flavum]MBT8798407.1 zeta toxin family protein [Microbacterium flavum]
MTFDADRTFESLIRPALFADSADAQPSLTLLVGEPGAGRTRAVYRNYPEASGRAVVSAAVLRAFHPDYLELASRRPFELDNALRPAVERWIAQSVGTALNERRSVVLESEALTAEAARAASAAFTEAGFTTEAVVMASRTPDSLLTAASAYLNQRRERIPTQPTTVDAHRAAAVAARDLTIALELEGPFDRVRVLNPGGVALHEAEPRRHPESLQGLAAALDAERQRHYSSIEGVQWLSELRRITEYARQSREDVGPVVETLGELHRLALTTVLPRMPLRPESEAAMRQRAQLEQELSRLEEQLAATRNIPAPLDFPTPAPSRGLDR